MQIYRKKLSQYFHTIRYLQFRQIYYRLHYACRTPRIKQIAKLNHRPWSKPWSAPQVLANCLSKSGIFSCLGETGQLADPSIWNSPHHTKLWLYNLHYFDALTAISSDANVPLFSDYIDTWITNNPPILGNGWEPYPISLRIVNWVKWISSKASHPKENWLISLSVQAEVLMQTIEYELQGNHVLANGKALVFIGSYFSGKPADLWLNKGLQILDKQIKEQFLADGGHFELSPMYHASLLWDLCDLVNLAKTTEIPVLTVRQAKWLTVIEQGLSWLSTMVHPDGNISFFNDAALKIAPTLVDLKRYASQLSIPLPEELNTDFAIQYLKNSGYCAVNLPHQSKAILDVAKLGPDYQPGHAHADTLSFELSLYGQRFIVNSGISSYWDGPLRQFQRSTAAHNTVCIDGMDSSEVWSRFRVARRAYPRDLSINSNPNHLDICCAHDGYLRLPGRHLHYREWQFSKNSLMIQDVITGTDADAEAHFYFHPDVEIIQEEKNQGIICSLAGGQKAKIEFSPSCKISIEPSFWYPVFGESIKNNCLIVRFKKNTLNTQLTWGLSEASWTGI